MKDSRIESLRPEFQKVTHLWLHMVTDDLGIKVRVLETLRDKARQEELEAAGKSRVKFGWHNVGLALDFATFNEAGVYQTDDASMLYLRCGLVAEALGCTWGGRWTNLKDYGHIEYHPGMTLQQFLNGQSGGLVA